MYHIQKIIHIISGQLLNAELYSAKIHFLLYDSRLLVQPSHTLFFAIKSKRSHGIHYINDLYQSGVRHFVIQQSIDISSFPNANFIFVPNVLKALQELAKFHKSQFNIPTIGITGSNGKTIIKEWLYQLLQDDFEIVRSPKSYNSQIGVPISVWQIAAQHNLAIIEAGISKTNEMKHLVGMVNCSIGIFSNIGDAHNDGFASMEEKVKEKSLLFQNAHTIIYNKDYPLIHQRLSQWADKRLFSWSKENNAALHSISIIKKGTQTHISGIYKNEKLDIVIPFVNDAAIENAIHCWACSLVLNIPSEIIKERFLRLTPVALRLELLAAVNHCTIINDSYSADLHSLTMALNFLNQQTTHPKNTVILSDFMEHKGESNTLYASIATLLIQKNHSAYRYRPSYHGNKRIIGR